MSRKERWFYSHIQDVVEGGTGSSDAATARANLGLKIGTNVQAWDNDLDDIAAITPTDSNILVGDGTDWVKESGNTARTSLGVGTGDSPQFTGVNVGHASDTTLTRVSAALIAVEGDNLIRASDVDDTPVNGQTAVPISSNWAFDHNAATLSASVHPIAGDVDFNKYKAIELVCDNGATMPATPTDGQWFLHTPTGRNVLYQQNSDWIPIISVGTMTMYVDKTDGTDDLNHGTAADASAFKTVQYAVNCIPGLVGGNVVIYVNAEDYDETVTVHGKAFSGSYSISIYGTLALQETVASATVAAGTGATQGTVTKAGAFAGDSYANLLAYFVTDDEYRLIDSHTDDVLTLVGTAPSSTAQNVSVYDWGTSINNIIVISGQKNIYLYDLLLDTGVALTVYAGGFVDGYRIKVSCSAGSFGVNVYTGGELTLSYSYLTINHIVAESHHHSYIVFWACKLYVSADNWYCIRTHSLGFTYLTAGTILDASSTVGTYGAYIYNNSVCECWASPTYGYPRIRNLAKGIYAKTGGMVSNTSNNQYSGNTADEDAEAASFGYID